MKSIDAELAGEVLVAVTVAVRFPASVGENVTLIVHMAKPPREAGQLLVWPKSPGFAPVMEMLWIVTLELVLLVSVSEMAALATEI